MKVGAQLNPRLTPFRSREELARWISLNKGYSSRVDPSDFRTLKRVLCGRPSCPGVFGLLVKDRPEDPPYLVTAFTDHSRPGEPRRYASAARPLARRPSRRGTDPWGQPFGGSLEVEPRVVDGSPSPLDFTCGSCGYRNHLDLDEVAW